MHLDEFREYCLSKQGTSEDFPFDESTLVFRVLNKIFAITGLDEEVFKVSLKCEPEYAIELREHYDEINPGWHMNKKHWNTVNFEGDLSDQFLKDLVNHSYDRVVITMKKNDRETLKNL